MKTKNHIPVEQEDLSRYLWKGLNLERYSVVKISPYKADSTGNLC